jgi:hypothetical protein
MKIQHCFGSAFLFPESRIFGNLAGKSPRKKKFFRGDNFLQIFAM